MVGRCQRPSIGHVAVFHGVRPVALDGVDLGRGLAADIAPGAAVHHHLEGKIAPEDIFSQEPGLPGHFRLPFDELGVQLIGGPDEKIGGLGPDRIARQDDALDDQVRVDIHQHPVLKGAGLHFVGVGHHIARKAGIGRDETPLAAGGEAGAAPPPEAGVQHQLAHFIRSPLLHGLD